MHDKTKRPTPQPLREGKIRGVKIQPSTVPPRPDPPAGTTPNKPKVS